MKHISKITKMLTPTVLIMGIILAFSGTAQANWYLTQGSAGEVQDVSVLTRPDIFYGWGMDLTVRSFDSTWVQYPIQLPYPQSIRKIYVDINLVDSACFIDEIAVWDGATKLHEFKNLGWQGSNRYHTILDMGTVHNPFAIGVSIQVKAGDGSARFQIRRVGAGH